MAKKIKPDEALKQLESRKKRHGRPVVKYQPNLTPLIDVLFLLLLFFLLGTKMRHEEGQIPATLPELGASVGSVEAKLLPEAIKITINPEGRDNETVAYEVGDAFKRISDAEDLYRLLLKQCHDYGASGADIPVIIKARSDVRWEFVVQAFNQAARARFKNIAFAPVSS